MNDVIRKLRLLKEEDYIWLIYFFIISFALISNKEERKAIITNNKNSERNAKNINSTILIIAFFIYLYFVLTAYDNLNILKMEASKKDVRVAFERLIANIVFLVGGAILIYADYDANNKEIDIAID